MLGMEKDIMRWHAVIDHMVVYNKILNINSFITYLKRKRCKFNLKWKIILFTVEKTP